MPEPHSPVRLHSTNTDQATTMDRGAEPRLLSRLGLHVYGAASVALGIIGLVWGDFASPWQPGLKDVPHAFAYLAAGVVFAGGLAVQRQRSTKIGLVLLTVPNLVFAIIWLGQCLLNWHPFANSNWLNLAEQLTLLLAPVIAFFAGSERQSAAHLKRYQVARSLFGLCAVAFGVAHFIFLEGTTKFGPQWLPPGPRFWALATGIGHLSAGIAILTGILAPLASRLFVAMILSFGALVWAPSLAAHPTSHLFWAGNAINLALAGAAWIMADAIAFNRRSGSTKRL